MKKTLFILALCLPHAGWAGVYKCTDAAGHNYYQSSPCTEEHKAVQMNTKTGSSVDLNAKEQQEAQAAAQKKQQELQQQADEQAKLDAIAQRKKQTQEQAALTQAMTKQNPKQFSAYAIPAYNPDKLPPLVKQYEERLPDIEKFRRLAAQKALANGQCERVEADELHSKSTKETLVFLVNCSSGASLYFNETDLAQ